MTAYMNCAVVTLTLCPQSLVIRILYILFQLPVDIYESVIDLINGEVSERSSLMCECIKIYSSQCVIEYHKRCT